MSSTEEESEEAFSCPICLATPNDKEGGEPLVFVRTPCGHIFRQQCLEHVLLKTNAVQDNITMPSKGRCPISRLALDLFDLRCATTGELVYSNDSASSWPIANRVYEERRIDSDSDLLGRAIESKGALGGHGLVFNYDVDGGQPRLQFKRPLNSIPSRSEGYSSEYLKTAYRTSVSAIHKYDLEFELERFHEESRLYRALIVFHDPVYEADMLFEKLEITLQFDIRLRYCRKGLLRWMTLPTKPTEFPLDGVFEARYSFGTLIRLVVYRHSFRCDGITYRIELDDSHRPSFAWPSHVNVIQRSTRQFVPGDYQAIVGEEIEWTTDVPHHDEIVWKRLQMHQGTYVDASISAGAFVYQRVDDDSSVIGPSYHRDQIWGNTFCQALTVGLASYHFMENEQAYISYESNQTSVWPNLDNGTHVSEIGRVPFRDIQWDAVTRTFRGSIDWEHEFNTAWQNEKKWRYTIVFDETYSFVHSGLVESDTRPPHVFARDLVYINAAIEGPLHKRRREAEANARSTGQYLDVLREWERAGASRSTMRMLGDVAMSVLNGDLNIIDYNL